ncbi:hypothetical protein [Clostridium botulinum]|uniref:hypothetical protein n=1 Tax=Clostridium botulinum TaxID=1491 RepID=UPI000772EABC|nr:hypothetical protein [Clostridium botulinum]MBN1058432.1 hypothetical protein [Clostridium botulinum]MBN1061727.1 hypothetical protein [Clostridium botulinum]NFG20863.1 hypothetical protein [Clostridium botulinum]NFH80323.1 hypothetical protein [Clostridium botulinum]NFH83712.1 hypothetical protein [Clostridium botulinum]
MKNKRYLISLIFVIVMIVMAEFTGEKEIIFPEVLALAVGAWISDKQPWKINKIGLVALMTLSSTFGTCIVRYFSFPLIIKFMIALIFIGLILKLTQTTLVPTISAAILPILLNTETWIYPISVCIMSVIIVLVQYGMEKYGLRECENKQVEETEISKNQRKLETIRLSKIFLVTTILAALAFTSKNMFIIAPPLIVGFIELSNVQSKARNNNKKIFMLFVFASIIGMVSRVFISEYLSLPLWVAGFIATIGIFICFEKLKVTFAPVAAIALLPMLLDIEKVKYFPIQVTLGSIVLIFLAMTIFKEETMEVSSMSTSINS